MSRRVDWNRVERFSDYVAVVVSTALGAGLIPIAPGTMGSIVGLPIAFFSAGWFWGWRVLLWTLVLAVGSWAARGMDQLMTSSDNQSIVIDEVFGLGISAWTAGHDWRWLAVAFVLFRFFDVVKIPPVRQIDRWSKKKASQRAAGASWWGGFGVMADDGLAAIQALVVVIILQKLHIFH